MKIFAVAKGICACCGSFLMPRRQQKTKITRLAVCMGKIEPCFTRAVPSPLICAPNVRAGAREVCILREEVRAPLIDCGFT